MKLKYRGKLKHLRKHLVMIDGVGVIGRSIVFEYLTNKEFKLFEKNFRWKKLLSECYGACIICGVEHKHLNPKKYKRYAFWWDLVKLLHGDKL